MNVWIWISAALGVLWLNAVKNWYRNYMRFTVLVISGKQRGIPFPNESEWEKARAAYRKSFFKNLFR